MKDFQVTLGLWLTSFKQGNYDLQKSLKMFLPLKVWYFFCILKFTYFSQLKKVLNGLWQWKDSDMSATFFKEILYISTNIFLVLAVHEIKYIRVLDDIWQRWWSWMSFRQKKKERKKTVGTIPLVKLKNQTPWSKLVVVTTVNSYSQQSLPLQSFYGTPGTRSPKTGKR